MFSSYVKNPTNYHFEGQDEDENILLLVRAHLVTNFPWIFGAILLILLPFFMPKIIILTGLHELLNLPDNFRFALSLINFSLILVIVFEGSLHWYFNVYLITNKRIIDISFESLLRKNIDMAPIENIEETDSTTAGLLGTIFNFGNVAIQTAGAKVAIDMIKIPNPSEVADFILDQAGKKEI